MGTLGILLCDASPVRDEKAEKRGGAFCPIFGNHYF